MVQVVNKSQQVVTAGLNPKASYSRLIQADVIAVEAEPAAYAFTPVVGQNVWCKQIWIQHMPRALDVGNYTIVKVLTGSGRPGNIGDIENWEIILTGLAIEGIPCGMRIWDGLNNLHWSFEKLFTGAARRFGIIANRQGVGNDLVQVQFEISEG